jgi:hypothetical protein
MSGRTDRIGGRRLLVGGGLLTVVVALGLLVSGTALGGKQRPVPKLSVRAVRVQPGQAPKDDTCSGNCSFPEGDIGLILSVTDSPCDGGYTFDVDPGDGSPRINGIPINGSCDTSQNPSVFTGSGQTDHVYTDESSGAYTVTFYWHDPDVGVIPGTLTLTIAEGDSLTGKGINIGVKPGKQFSGAIATFTDTPANGYTAPASDMFPTVDWGDGSPIDSSKGTITVSDNGDGTFTISGRHTYKTDSGPGPFLITIKLEDDSPGSASATTHANARERDFTATPTDKVMAGSTISYAGSNFDSSGTPIVVGWDDLIDPVQNTTLGAALNFNGTQTADFGHPIKDYDTACTAKLTATQDGATDTIPITGIKEGVVLADRNFFRITNHRAVLVQPPDFVCQGEQFASQSPSDVIFDDTGTGVLLSPAGHEAVFNISDTGGVTVPVHAVTAFGRNSTAVDMARGATLCLPLGFGASSGGAPAPPPGGTVYGSVEIPQNQQGPFQAGQIGRNCLASAPHGTGIDVIGGFCDTPGVERIRSGLHTSDLTIHGNTCLEGEGTRSLTVLGDLRLESGVLAVSGNLAVTGTVSGVGGLLVNGSTSIAGSLRVNPEDEYAITAGGDVAVGSN